MPFFFLPQKTRASGSGRGWASLSAEMETGKELGSRGAGAAPGRLGPGGREGSGDAGSGQRGAPGSASTAGVFVSTVWQREGREGAALGFQQLPQLLAGTQRSHYKSSSGGCMHNAVSMGWLINSTPARGMLVKCTFAWILAKWECLDL